MAFMTPLSPFCSIALNSNICELYLLGQLLQKLWFYYRKIHCSATATSLQGSMMKGDIKFIELCSSVHSTTMDSCALQKLTTGRYLIGIYGHVCVSHREMQHL